jgi:CheY-like chemotaxis protein
MIKNNRNKRFMINKKPKMIYQENSKDSPAKRRDRGLVSALAADRPELLHSTCMMAQGDETADSQAPVHGSPQSQQHGAPRHQGDAPQVTVLIIDDEEPVRETLVEVLSISGYRTITAASVGEAEEAKERLGIEGIHLLISDIHLTPGRQIRAGYVLAQRWRTERPELPVILISGDSSNQHLPDVLAGAVRFLLKPFRMEVLLDTVREALGR